MNKFELIHFAIRSDRTVFEQGRFDCINGKFDSKEAKEFMNHYKITLLKEDN